MVAPSEPTSSAPASKYEPAIVVTDEPRLIFVAGDGSLNQVDEDAWDGSHLTQRDWFMLEAFVKIAAQRVEQTMHPPRILLGQTGDAS